LRLRQQDVAAAAGLNRGRVTKLEAGQIDELRVREVRSCFEALGARLDLVAGYRGAQLDRLLDELHAAILGAVVAILGAVVAILRSDGWEVRIEVSFAIGGERNRSTWSLGKRKRGPCWWSKSNRSCPGSTLF
jgi:transcriptional regulator with XRE-family HTH domain